MYQHSTLIWYFPEAKAQADKAKASEFIFCFPVSFWHIYGTTCSPCISISIAQRKAMGYGPIFWDVKVGWERIIDLAQNMERAILSLYSPNNLFWIEASTFWWRHMPKQFHGTMMIGWHRGTSLFKNFKKVTEKDLLTRRSNTCNNLEFAQERIFISVASGNLGQTLICVTTFKSLLLFEKITNSPHFFPVVADKLPFALPFWAFLLLVRPSC